MLEQLKKQDKLLNGLNGSYSWFWNKNGWFPPEINKRLTRQRDGGERITLPCRRISNDELAVHPAPSKGGALLPLHFKGRVDLWVESQGTSRDRRLTDTILTSVWWFHLTIANSNRLYPTSVFVRPKCHASRKTNKSNLTETIQNTCYSSSYQNHKNN